MTLAPPGWWEASNRRGVSRLWLEMTRAIYIPDENERTGVYAYQPDGQPFDPVGERTAVADRNSTGGSRTKAERG